MRYVVGVWMPYTYYSYKNLYIESWFHKRYVCRYMQMNICKFIFTPKLGESKLAWLIQSEGMLIERMLIPRASVRFRHRENVNP